MLFQQPTPQIVVNQPTQDLFVYGTLKNPMTQISVFGRYDAGEPDILIGYRTGAIRLGNASYPVLQPDQSEFVTGLRIAVTDDELGLIDQYETRAYQRTKTTPRSGKSCWVYLQASYL